MSNPFHCCIKLASCATALLAAPAFAAQVTDVADAVDGDDAIDVYLQLKFDVLRSSGTLTRENFQPPQNEATGKPRVVDVKEMSFERARFRLRPRLDVGVFHDLAVFAEWPVVIWDQTAFRYAEGTDTSNSTLARDQAPNASPSVDGWPETEGSGNDTLEVQDGKFGFPGKPYNQWRFQHGEDGAFTGYRQGFDNPTFGVRFSPLGFALDNDVTDTSPSVVLQADYTPPLFQFMDPTNDVLDDPQNPGPVADGAHRFHFSVAMSKRFLILDPYFVIDYTLPLAAQSGGSILGYFPRQAGGFRGGVEIVPFEDKGRAQRFAIDVSAYATYFSEGRDYSVASDVLGEQTYSDQWIETGVNAGIFFRAFEYFFFDVSGNIGVDSDHLITIEDFGTDGSDPGSQINLENSGERNPYYNPAIDTVGRRLRVEQSLRLGVVAQAGLTF